MFATTLTDFGRLPPPPPPTRTMLSGDFDSSRRNEVLYFCWCVGEIPGPHAKNAKDPPEEIDGDASGNLPFAGGRVIPEPEAPLNGGRLDRPIFEHPHSVGYAGWIPADSYLSAARRTLNELAELEQQKAAKLGGMS